MEEMDLFVSAEEISHVASKMKKKEENGDWVVVFYLEERVFGIVPLTALKPMSDVERLQPGQLFKPYERLRAVYGKSVLDVLYLYRGTNDEEMEQFAKELDKLRRQNKQQPKSNQEGKRVRKRKQFSEYETEDCAEQTVMTDKTNLNRPKSPAVTIKKKASQNKHSKKEEIKEGGALQVKDIGNMSMLAGFSNLIDEPFDVPLSEVLEENRKLVELEPFGDKVMRLEEELYEERKKVQALEEKLAFKDDVPNVVMEHIVKLTDLIREYFPRQGNPVKQSMMQPSLQEPTVMPPMMTVGTVTKHEKENMKEPAQKVKPRCVQAPTISEKVERALPEEKNIPMGSQGSEHPIPNTARVGEGQLCEKLEENHGNFGNQRTNRNLKKERNDHLECQALLKAERLRREFAEGEVEILKAQMERERKKYEECFQKLKNRAVEESARKSEIESQCSIIAYEKQQKEDLVHLNETKIHDLKKRLSKQKKSHQSQMDEINIRIQQEAYINKTLVEKEKNKKTR